MPPSANKPQFAENSKANEAKVESPRFEPRTPQSPKIPVWSPTRPLALSAVEAPPTKNVTAG